MTDNKCDRPIDYIGSDQIESCNVSCLTMSHVRYCVCAENKK